MVNYKKPAIEDKTHLHIFSICLRLVLPSSAEIQNFQVEPSRNSINTNENMILKMFVCTDSSDEHIAFDGL